MDARPRQGPPPLTEKESNFIRGTRKKCRFKEMQLLLAPKQQESTRKTLVPTNNLPYLFPHIFLFHFLSCQSESSGLLNTFWVPTQEAWRSFFILIAADNKCSPLKEPKGGFSDRSRFFVCVFAFFQCLWATSKTILQQLKIKGDRTDERWGKSQAHIPKINKNVLGMYWCTSSNVSHKSDKAMIPYCL